MMMKEAESAMTWEDETNHNDKNTIIKALKKAITIGAPAE